MKEIISILIGVFLSVISAIIAYFFGNKRKKDDIMQEIETKFRRLMFDTVSLLMQIAARLMQENNWDGEMKDRFGEIRNNKRILEELMININKMK